MNTVTPLALALALCASAAPAGGHANWTSVDADSRVAFGSIKLDTVGEIHHFNGVSGTVSEAGALTVSIDLSSVETYIDIRNDRMMEHVFQAGTASAVLTGEIDMAAVTDLAVGATTVMGVEGTLAFAGVETDVETDMLVARLGEDRVLVSTADFIMLSTDDLGIDTGVDTLMELASLPGITRVSPVAIRMVFEK
ncbi:YceI family protein [uncultured Roseobacter sp.]|uniref:YceI family protein n=1 Tax=uncultured Roseobacter sp. TaxID=114847 RepID=UPI00260EFFF3|nr:YceI family protein [uncultured Roseobacter sp.]